MARNKRPEGTRAPNGASSIYQGKDGKWHGRVTMGVRDDGKPDRRHVERKTEAEVIKAVRKLEKERDSGQARKPGRVETVEQWLTHWVENIAAPNVRATTMVGYRASVYKHLIPGVGAHRLDKLQPEHLEKLYGRMIAPKPAGKGLKPATAHLAHRTVRVALNEAVRRGRIGQNPATIAKAPRVEEEEIVPFTVEEAQRLFDVALTARNGARFIVALALGLRRGEALGLRWSDVDIHWEHGCAKASACRTRPAAKECSKRIGSGTLTVRRAIQQFPWKHGCPGNRPCGERYAARCPDRHGGGIVVGEVKSRAGRRTVGLPAPLIQALEAHRLRQTEERERAADLWQEQGWVFTDVVGNPLHPKEYHRAWKSLLRKADVRDARLHDARHTAATMLLVLKVPLPAVMEIMGWSDAAIAKRYMHVPRELVQAIATDVGELMWAQPTDDEPGDLAPELTADQHDAIQQLASTLPQQWAQQLIELLPNEDDEGSAGSLESA
ncbi:site-specific integrase [Amycolatopsis rhizosphaerae]|uniref:Site-specific integrase n=1 Tax=Amycolatopsis rhizosphaerae TaxID=2053003 RepID=A0A558CPP8_9PSEU|nr:site-specific integrase [Amycolatopsis rhizosphaerae]TVT50727.1 site-specific integrase [Amycolatopsis rhizosphaerae]